MNHPTEAKAAELALLRIALQDPVHFNEFIRISDAFPSYRKLAHQLQQFWEEFRTAPERDTFRAWCRVPEALDQFAAVLRETAPDPKQAHVYAEILRGTMLARGMLELAEYLADTVGKKPHHDVLRAAQERVTKLGSGLGIITRDWWSETAPERWKEFMELAKNPRYTLKFGIPELDRASGGLHALSGEADLVCIFGKPGTYKSRLMINLAYNQATQGLPVLFISCEMSTRRVGLLLDARESVSADAKGGTLRLEQPLLQDGNLQGKYRTRYKNLLVTVYKRAYPLRVVGCPDVINTADIAVELELFCTQHGELPKVVYLDYANLIDPMGVYNHESQKMDRIFQELVGLTKKYSVPLVTAVRESRGGSLKREREDVGIEHIGLSQAIGYHVHQLWHLDHDKDERAYGRLSLRMKKNRYGELADISLFVTPEFNYVGDTELPREDGYADFG